MLIAKHPFPFALIVVLLLAVTVQLTLATHASADIEDNGGIDPPAPPGGDGSVQQACVGIVDLMIAKLPWLLRFAAI